MGLAFSAMSFHLILLLDDRGVLTTGVVMAIIALIGPMQVVGRVLLMVGQRHITTIQLGAIDLLRLSRCRWVSRRPASPTSTR